MSGTTSAKDILRQYWGYDSFRGIQEDIIGSILSGKDTLGLMPTGGGKSLCFQVPALMTEGLNIVVTPLIALMKDQVGRLKMLGIKAEAIYSGMMQYDVDKAYDNCLYGNYKFLYISPERLATEQFRQKLTQMKRICMITVDEAHCVSQWGYDFRPPYLRIAEVRDIIPYPVPILALTATATPKVVDDIQERLKFSRPHDDVPDLHRKCSERRCQECGKRNSDRDGYKRRNQYIYPGLTRNCLSDLGCDNCNEKYCKRSAGSAQGVRGKACRYQ